jgi:DNA replication protein DnaC
LTACAACGGTGFTIVEREGREYAERCSCRRAAGAGAEGRARDALRIPPRYEHCTLAAFAPGNASLAAALERALRYCAEFPHAGEDEGLGLLFTGDNGVGKTHLAVAVLRELAERKGVRGQFWDFQELMRVIRNSYDASTQQTELQVLEPVIEAGLLVLDDLGAWKMTDWMNDTLFYILNSRYVARRPTLITTNYQDADREAVLAADPMRRREYLVERIGQRLRSRLMEMCAVIPLHGPDHRRIRQEGLLRGRPGPRERG